MDVNEKPLVLVVNDDDAMRQALQYSLRLEGIFVSVHASAASVLADENLPRADCLILQERMTDADAFALMASLRARGLAVPVLLLTAGATPALRARAAAAGVRLVLETPLLDNALLEGLLRILAGRHAS